MTVPHATVVALSLREFRNFERLDLAIAPEGLAVVGENGHGKTNLLESVAYASLLRSVRGARDVDVVRFGAEGFYIDARVCAPDAHHIGIGFEKHGRRKRVRLDDAPVERFSDALGVLPTVMFSPSDVELVAGAPSARRRYLDVMLAQTSRRYLRALQQYRAALERRNAALRAAQKSGRDGQSIDVWDAPLAEHGAAMVESRRRWIESAAPRFADRCSAIGERSAVALHYVPSVEPDGSDDQSRIAQALAARRESDLRHGVTQVGPHRDELALLLGGRDMRSFGSAGQQRTAAIALRLLEAETLREARAASPVFLLDDPFAELDDQRASRVLALLDEVGLGQTILAVPRDSEIPREFLSLPVRRVVDGRLAP